MVLHSTIFPNMVKGRAIRIADWLGSIVDGGGPLALLSMNGLFLLIKDYNL
jgi:U3 small nucleolar RNA-associated protein 19